VKYFNRLQAEVANRRGAQSQWNGAAGLCGGRVIRTKLFLRAGGMRFAVSRLRSSRTDSSNFICQ